jgi:hypothetical protein
VFRRLLNALLSSWRTKADNPARREDSKSPGQAPSHWMKSRASAPPRHWLEATQNAVAQMQGKTDCVEAEHSDAPRREPEWKKQSTAERQPATEATKAESQPEFHVFQNRFSENNRAPVPVMTFPDGGNNVSGKVQWNPSLEEKKGPLARFFGWIMKAPPVKAADKGREVPKPDGKPGSAQVLKFESNVLRSTKHQATWELPSRTAQVPLRFPKSASGQRKPGSPDYAPKVPAPVKAGVGWGRQSRYQDSTRVQPLGDRDSAPIAQRTSPVVAHEERQAPPNASPLCWPELPSGRVKTATSFVDQKMPKEVTPGAIVIDTVSNSWPELPTKRVTNEHNWRSVLRSIERRQQLEKEQRGY